MPHATMQTVHDLLLKRVAEGRNATIDRSLGNLSRNVPPKPAPPPVLGWSLPGQSPAVGQGARVLLGNGSKKLSSARW